MAKGDARRAGGLGRVVVVVGLSVGMTGAWAQPAPQGERGGERGGDRGGERGGDRGGMRGPGSRMGGGGGPMGMIGLTPAISGRQFARYGEMLGLDADQGESARAMHEAYRRSVGELDEKMRGQRDELREKMMSGELDRTEMMQVVREGMEKARAQREKMDADFLSGVKALLTESQEAEWPRVERRWVRDTTLTRGRLSGEGVDLVELVDDLELDLASHDAVSALIERYEQEMDTALKARNKVYDEQARKFGDAMRDRDEAGMDNLISSARQAGVRVRDVNRTYARQIADAIAGEAKGKFEDSFKRASHPGVYRETQVSREMSAAEQMELTPEQREKLSALRAGFERDAGPINERMSAEQEKREMEFGAAQIGQRFMGRRGPGGGGGEGEEDAMGAIRRERRELEARTGERLREILTPEQAEKLPKAERAGGRGGDRGGDRGGERGRRGGERTPPADEI